MTEQLDELVIDRTTPIQRPSDQQIKQWASNKRVFISSTMEDLGDVRQAVADTIAELNAQPVMFETLGARTDDSRQAYTSEVRRSQIYLGILSRRYGTELPSGYSATHEEYEEARKFRKEILLFLDASVPDRDRDGRLNDWLQELYQFHVLSKYEEVADLVQQVRTSIIEVASDELTPWVKLDHVIFQATRVETRTVQGATTIEATTASQDSSITGELLGMARERFGRTNRRLTFRHDSYEVEVKAIEETIDPLGNDSLVLTCTTVDERYQGQNKHSLLQMRGGYRTPSGSWDYRDLVEIALRSVALGEEPPDDSLFRSYPQTDFSDLYQQYGDDVRIFPKVAQLLIVESIYQHGIVDQLEYVSVGNVRDRKLRVSLSAILPRPYSNAPRERVEIEEEVEVQ